jgi:hypothetical protein
MALRRPTTEELKELAAANYFNLNSDELTDFADMIPGCSTPSMCWTAPPHRCHR